MSTFAIESETGIGVSVFYGNVWLLFQPWEQNASEDAQIAKAKAAVSRIFRGYVEEHDPGEKDTVVMTAEETNEFFDKFFSNNLQ